MKDEREKKSPSTAPNGRTLATKDKYLPTDKKGKSKNPKDARRVVIIDSNPYAEYAVVRLTTKEQPNTTQLKDYGKRNGGEKTYFKHFVEIEDFEGKPITIDNKRFKENPKSFDLSKSEVKSIQNITYHKCKQAKSNIEKIQKLKSRHKKG